MERPPAEDFHPDIERGRKFRTPSERQITAFARSGLARITLSVSVGGRTYLPDIDISQLYELRTGRPRFAWVETDHFNFVRIVVSSEYQELPSRKIQNAMGDTVPAVQILGLQDAWQIRAERIYGGYSRRGSHFSDVKLSIFNPVTGEIAQNGIYSQI